MKTDFLSILGEFDEAIEELAGLLIKGGPGSGHRGHKGRPGKVGGSVPNNGVEAGPSQEIPADIMAMPFYHGTDSQAIADEIIKDGEIVAGETRTKGKLAPVEGRAYVTSDPEYALIYALGGDMAGHELPESFFEHGRYGYIFQIDPKSFDDIQPDEDSIGEALSDHRYEWLDRLGQRYLSPNQLSDVEFGFYEDWAASGKKLVQHMTPEQKFQMVRDGAHIANLGALDIKAAWRIDKKRSANFLRRNYMLDDTTAERKKRVARIWEIAEPVDLGLTERGGPGSGHHGHKGRPGQRGGSLPGAHNRFWENGKWVAHIPVKTHLDKDGWLCGPDGERLDVYHGTVADFDQFALKMHPHPIRWFEAKGMPLYADLRNLGLVFMKEDDGKWRFQNLSAENAPAFDTSEQAKVWAEEHFNPPVPTGATARGAIFFAENPEYAARDFARTYGPGQEWRRGEDPRLIQVHLRFNKLLRHDAPGSWDVVKPYMKHMFIDEVGEWDSHVEANVRNAWHDGSWALKEAGDTSFTDYLKAKGYDGYTNIEGGHFRYGEVDQFKGQSMEDYVHHGGLDRSVVYAVLDPAQIEIINPHAETSYINPFEKTFAQWQEAIKSDYSVNRGGPGSGHHGHKGRPGQVGGSAPGKDSPDYAPKLPEPAPGIGVGDPVHVTAFHTILPYDALRGFEQNGPGKYLSLDKPFYEGAGPVLTAEVDIDPTTIFDPNGVFDGSNIEQSKLDWEPQFDWVNDVGRQKLAEYYDSDAGRARQAWLMARGYKAIAGWIEPGLPQFGRELVIFDRSSVKLTDPRTGEDVTGKWYDWDKQVWTERGGPGSGHFGHAGRPGEVGGSQPGGAVAVAEPEAKISIPPSVKAENFKGILYHGTLRDYGESINDFGVLPQVGGFVSNAYGEYEEAGIDLPEYAYFASPNNIATSLTAMTAQIAIAMDKPFHEITREDVRQNGLMLAVTPKDAEFVSFGWQQEDQTADYLEYNTDPDEGPIGWVKTDNRYSTDPGPETYDYFTSDEVKPSQWLYGDELLKFIDAQGYKIERSIAPSVVRIFIPRGGPGSGHHGHKGRPGEIGGSAPSGPALPDSMDLTEAERRRLGEEGILLHAASTEFAKFDISKTPHGAIYFSDPSVRPNSVTQAEYIGRGPFGGRLIFATLDRDRLKWFDPRHDPEARKIFTQLFPGKGTMSTDGRILGMLHYVFIPELIHSKGYQSGGYNAIRVYEPSVQGESIAVTDDSLIHIVGDTRETNGPPPWDLLFEKRGGPGSGHHAHKGRPGEVGGSLPGAAAEAVAGDRDRSGIRSIVPLEDIHSRKKVEAEIAAAKESGGFGAPLYRGNEAIIYDDREAFTQAVMMQASDAKIEVGFSIDDHGYVDVLNYKEWLTGKKRSMNIPTELIQAYSRSEADGLHPVLIHSHPKTEGVARSSPPSVADLRVSMVEGVLKQSIAAHDGYYEFEFSHPLDSTEREEWNQVAGIWAEDHPESEGLMSYRKNSLGRVGHGTPPPDVTTEIYRRQHDALVYAAKQMPDIFSYRFVPWE